MGCGEIRRAYSRPALGRNGDGGLLTVGMVKLLCSLPAFSAGDVTNLYFRKEEHFWHI